MYMYVYNVHILYMYMYMYMCLFVSNLNLNDEFNLIPPHVCTLTVNTTNPMLMYTGRILHWSQGTHYFCKALYMYMHIQYVQ